MLIFNMRKLVNMIPIIVLLFYLAVRGFGIISDVFLVDKEENSVEQGDDNKVDEWIESEIRELVSTTDAYDVYKIFEDRDVLHVLISMEEESLLLVKEYTENLTKVLAKGFKYEQSVRVTAMEELEVTDERIRVFGSAIYRETEGKFYPFEGF